MEDETATASKTIRNILKGKLPRASDLFLIRSYSGMYRQFLFRSHDNLSLVSQLIRL